MQKITQSYLRMRIKAEIFCFAHLRWCHNGWVSNILIVVDTGYAGIIHSKYWMPIHYDTIEDWHNKKSHLLFSNWRRVSFTDLEWRYQTNNTALCNGIASHGAPVGGIWAFADYTR